eukprot:2001825-Lingulodinium_polyedra.AAC.1
MDSSQYLAVMLTDQTVNILVNPTNQGGTIPNSRVVAAAAWSRGCPLLDGVFGIGTYEATRRTAELGRPKLANVATRAL